jgi:hypothetical protein
MRTAYVECVGGAWEALAREDFAHASLRGHGVREVDPEKAAGGAFGRALVHNARRQGIRQNDFAQLQKSMSEPVAEGVVRLFACHNEYKIKYPWGYFNGICTAASFAWAKRRMQGPIASLAEVGNAHHLQIQHAKMVDLDRWPDEQTELAGVQRVWPIDIKVNSMRQVIDLGYQQAPNAVIFWSAGHTMALWTDGQNVEFFDNARGCFLAKDRESIERQMNMAALKCPPIGARLVRLPS